MPRSPDIDAALDANVQKSLGPIAATVGAIFLFFAGLDLALRPGPMRLVFVALELGEGTILLGVALVLRRTRPPARHANATFAAMMLFFILSLVLTHRLDPGALPLSYFGIIALGAGMVFLSWPWLAAALALTSGASIALAGGELSNTYFVLASAGASIVLHMVRLRLYASEARARAALQESEERFRRLADATSEAIVIHADGKIREVNKACEEMFGRPAASVIGQPILDYIAPEHHERVLAAVTAGSSASYEAEGLRANGDRFPVRARGRTIQHEGKRARISAITDLTEEKRVQSELKAQLTVQARLEKLATIGTLSAGVAHEVNNPLTFMTVETSLFLADLQLLTDDALPPGWRERALTFAQTNKQGIDRITRIVDSLRLLAKPHAPTHAVELGPIIGATLMLAKTRLKQHEVLVEVPEGLHVHAEMDGVGQVILNLLINAADALPKEGGRILVRAARVQGGRVRVIVEDDGSGIPADARARLFTPFFTTKEKGTGLGLSISSRIATDAGGSLRFEDASPRGTRFILELVEAATPPAIAPIPKRG